MLASDDVSQQYQKHSWNSWNKRCQEVEVHWRCESEGVWLDVTLESFLHNIDDCVQVVTV